MVLAPAGNEREAIEIYQVVLHSFVYMCGEKEQRVHSIP